MGQIAETIARAVYEAEPNSGYWAEWDDLIDDPDHADNLAFADGYQRRAGAIIAALDKAAYVIAPKEPDRRDASRGQNRDG